MASGGTSGNWLPTVLPAAGDYVLIAEPGLGMNENVNISVGSVTIENGMTANQNSAVTLSAGSMNLGFDAFTGSGSYNLNSGTVTLAQSLNLGVRAGRVSAIFTVGGGQLNVGSINIAAVGSSTMTVNSGAVNCTGTLTVTSTWRPFQGCSSSTAEIFQVGTIQILANGIWDTNNAGFLVTPPDTELNGGRTTGSFRQLGDVQRQQRDYRIDRQRGCLRRQGQYLDWHICQRRRCHL